MRALLFCLCLLALPAQAQDTDLELVLLADASGSIDQSELMLQRQGYAQAMTDPEVVAAISRTAYGSIAVTYVEWATNTGVVADWAVIDGPESAAQFAQAILDGPRTAWGRNAIGAALIDALRMMEMNDIDGWRRVIDFSGDTMANFIGPTIEEAREQVLAAGVTINALPILRPNDPGAESGLAALYENHIIGGRGAFVVAARTRDSFAEAVKRKLILEIAGSGGELQIAGR